MTEPISIMADPTLAKATRRNITEFLEIELEVGEFILITISDLKLKAKISTALLTINALCRTNPFCR